MRKFSNFEKKFHLSCRRSKILSWAEISGPSRDQNQLISIRIVKNEEIGERGKAYIKFKWTHDLFSYFSFWSSIKAFELDPRSRPPLENVFFYQNDLLSIVSISTFIRTLNLFGILSGLNSVKTTWTLIKKLIVKMIGWIFFMIPFTVAFSLVGMIFMNSYRYVANKL